MKASVCLHITPLEFVIGPSSFSSHLPMLLSRNCSGSDLSARERQLDKYLKMQKEGIKEKTGKWIVLFPHL